MSDIHLDPIDVPKASDVLADELRERILSGELPAGTALPPERELVAQTKLSRATVREALRVLEVQGLLQVKVGRSGGAFVQHPDSESMADSIGLVIRGQQIRLAALHEMREVIEPTCAALAAQRRSSQDVDELRAVISDMRASVDDLSSFLRHNVRWHIRVAEAGRNELLLGFLSAISWAIEKSIDLDHYVDASVRDTAIRAHEHITEAISDREPETARRRMARHVHDFAAVAVDVDRREHIVITERGPNLRPG